MFRFEDLTKEKKGKELKDIRVNEVSVVDSPANNVPFLFFKSQAGETLNPLEQLLSVEKFEGAEIAKVDACLKQLDFLDDESADAVATLVLGACGFEVPYEEGESVGHFFSKAAMEPDESVVISEALSVIEDLDGESLAAVGELIKLASGGVIQAKWPSISKQQSATQESATPQSSVQDAAPSANVNKSGLLWASISGEVTAKSQPTKKSSLKWPTLVSQS